MVFVPPTEPEPVTRKVLEYMERRWERERAFCHCAVRHQVPKRPRRCRIIANTIQTETDICEHKSLSGYETIQWDLKTWPFVHSLSSPLSSSCPAARRDLSDYMCST